MSLCLFLEQPFLVIYDIIFAENRDESKKEVLKFTVFDCILLPTFVGKFEMAFPVMIKLLLEDMDKHGHDGKHSGNDFNDVALAMTIKLKTQNTTNLGANRIAVADDR